MTASLPSTHNITKLIHNNITCKSERMTASSSISSSLIDNVPKSTSLTRKSIKKYFPLGAIMSKGNNNPITLHSVNEDVFPRLWSFMAEVMVVEGELARSTKEAVALMVSSKNHCPMCVTAHTMMGKAARRAENTKDRNEQARQEALHNAAMNYAELLIDETLNAQNLDDSYRFCMLEEALEEHLNEHSSNNNFDPDAGLTEAGKAEVALVVVLYNHMNRIMSAVLGEQMSAAMFSVPRPAARRMESPSVMRHVNKLMAPFLAGGMKRKRSPGITASLFPAGPSCLEDLPDHLMGAEVAGEERATALSRLVAWAAVYEEQVLEQGIVSQEVIALLDDPQNAPADLRTHTIVKWATIDMKPTINSLKDKTSRAIANVLLLVSYNAGSAFNSIHWKTLLKELGADEAKTLVIWWSLRFTFRRTKGLRSKAPKEEQPGW